MLAAEVMKMSASAWPSVLSVFVISVLATYLTGVWELSIVQAAQILNVYTGVSTICPLLVQLIFKEETLAKYGMVLFTRFAYTAGFVMLTMSAPPVLSLATGTCTEQEAECVGQVQKNLFYIGLTLLGVTDCIHNRSTGVFLMTNLMRLVSSGRVPETLEPRRDSEQLLQPELESSEQSGKKTRYRGGTNLFCFLCEQQSCWSYMLLILVGFILIPLAATIAISYVGAWWIKFTISSAFAVASLVAMLCITLDDGLPPAQFGVVVPRTPNYVSFYEDGICPLWVVPICINYLLLTVVYSVGDTFFIEQATDLSLYLWIFKTATTVLPLFQKVFKLLISIPMAFLSEPFSGTFVSIILATLCCITAAKVETRRLSVVKAEGVIGDPDAVISMSICWLIPQFILLGVAEGFSQASFSFFFKNNLPGMPSEYSENIAESVKGVGILCGVLSVQIVSQIQPTWFQSTLNTSRLDNYYWVLAALSAINLFLFPLGILIYAAGLPEESRRSMMSEYSIDGLRRQFYDACTMGSFFWQQFCDTCTMCCFWCR